MVHYCLLNTRGKQLGKQIVKQLGKQFTAKLDGLPLDSK